MTTQAAYNERESRRRMIEEARQAGREAGRQEGQEQAKTLAAMVVRGQSLMKRLSNKGLAEPRGDRARPLVRCLICCGPESRTLGGIDHLGDCPVPALEEIAAEELPAWIVDLAEGGENDGKTTV